MIFLCVGEPALLRRAIDRKFFQTLAMLRRKSACLLLRPVWFRFPVAAAHHRRDGESHPENDDARLRLAGVLQPRAGVFPAATLVVGVPVVFFLALSFVFGAQASDCFDKSRSCSSRREPTSTSNARENAGRIERRIWLIELRHDVPTFRGFWRSGKSELRLPETLSDARLLSG